MMAAPRNLSIVSREDSQLLQSGVSVEERQLLRAVRGIVGRVQIDGDAISAMAQPLGLTPDHALRHRSAKIVML